MTFDILCASPEEAVAWCRWIYSIPHNPPQDNNPAKGGKCDQNQNNPDLFFLVGTTGGEDLQRQTCVSVSRYILIPIIVTMNSTAEFPGWSEDQLLVQARNENVDPLRLELTIDAISVQNLEQYLLETLPFELELPQNNILGVNDGYTRCISVGYYVKLRFRETGWHMIEFGGKLQMGFYSKTKYRINVN